MMKALQAHTCVNLDGRPMGRVRRTHGAFLYLKMNEISTGSYICTGYVNTPIYMHIHIHTQARILFFPLVTKKIWKKKMVPRVRDTFARNADSKRAKDSEHGRCLQTPFLRCN